MYRIKELQSRIKNFGQSYNSYWGCALIGEIGELANFIKKNERYNTDAYNEDIGKEIADIFIYLELICRHFRFKLDRCIKCAEVWYIKPEYKHLSDIILHLGLEIGGISLFMLDRTVATSPKTKIGTIYLLIKLITKELNLDLYTIINDKITEIEDRR